MASNLETAQFKHEIRVNHVDPRMRADDCDVYETYSIAYDDDFRDRFERKSMDQARRDSWDVEDNRYAKVEPMRGSHVARIEIANNSGDEWHHKKLQSCQPEMKMRKPQHKELSNSEQQQLNAPHKTRSIPPPPPCMKNFEVIDGYRPTMNQISIRQQKGDKSSQESQSKREEQRYVSEPQPRRPRFGESTPSIKVSSDHQTSPKQRPNKMVIVNMVKSPQNAPRNPHENSKPSRNKLSTNPFLNASERTSPRQAQNVVKLQQIKNVQEVIQKMNNGDWPIKVSDEEMGARTEVPNTKANRNSYDEPKEKAMHWETLPKNRQSPQEDDRERSHHTARKRQDNSRKEHRGKEEHSDQSDSGERTTISTDSAFGSDVYHSSRHLAEPQLMLCEDQQHARELEQEATKLLMSRELEQNEPKITKLRAPSDHEDRRKFLAGKVDRVERTLPAQLRTDDVNYDWDECNRGYSSDGDGDRRDGRKADSRSGRFVKKSAAALIAKKQGFSSQINLEQPSSSEIVDPRIASEIRALREREEELRRSRTELGLPTLDDVMNRGFPGGLRAARSYDQLHLIANQHSQDESFLRAADQKNRYDHGSLTHSPQKETQKKKRRQHEVQMLKNHEHKSYGGR
ncbi:unnamed protein product [Nippostrongylus brasiliensis]|uniref:CLASP_N domain-containing protein n=1 Tax=Nippostrongylus brasiliensis TaxID=27835 RepID=A0A158R1B0_NIPBR|nr:unnamed protein product [Nippostrongylus brasiliensis]